MRFNFTRGIRRRAVVLLTLVIALPVLSGCSTLGIATTEELSATEARMDSANNSTSTRLDGLEQSTSDMQATLNQMSASVDTLNTRFARASEWIKTMNIDTISEDAQAATSAATAAEARIHKFLTHYLEWLKAQQTVLGEQIKTLEAAMNDKAGSLAEPAGSAGDDDSSSDGDGQ